MADGNGMMFSESDASSFERMFESLNKAFEIQRQAMMGLHKLVMGNIAEETEAEKKSAAEVHSYSDDLDENYWAERRKRTQADNDIRKKAVEEYYDDLLKAHADSLDELEGKEREAAEKRLKDMYAREAKHAGDVAVVRDRTEEALQKKRASDANAANELLEKNEIARIEKAAKIEEEWLELRKKKQQEALEQIAAQQGRSVEELSKDEINAALKLADQRTASLEDYKKIKEKQEQDDLKKNKKLVVDYDPNKSKTENFRNAFGETKSAVKDAFKNKYSLDALAPRDPETGNRDASKIVNGLANFAQSLNNKIDDSGKHHQTRIDTRLYGSSSNDQALGSYWRSLSNDIMSIAGASPLILQTDMIASLEKLVGSGISHNIKLRAFLDTITNKIATTFEVNDSTMLRLIRMQQQDTTAARMGMESALNAFLNNMFETTEYLSNLADSVRGNLVEAQALMGAKEATEFEYQVQKWLGSFYSVGMSDSAVTNISNTLGQLAAGQIEALTGSGTGNLMIMAANEAGLSIADILKDGLDADTTNKLMQAMVDYLAQIATQSDSKVIQQQLAGVFGMQASDIKSVLNLVSDNSKTIKNIANTNVTNEGMIAELIARAATMTARVSVGEMMSNVWENVQYTMAAGIANNPATYLLYKTAGLLEQAVGGIPISFLNVYGFGVDLNTSVAQLMQAGAMAGGILGSMGSMLGALGNMVGGGATMLATAGLFNQGKAIHRGNGAVGAANLLSKSGISTSSSGLVGNSSSEDMTGATMASGQDDIDSQGQQGKDENEDATRDDIIEILKMLFGLLGEKIDENTQAVRGGGLFNSDNTGVGGFTNASTTLNSVV